jgi:NAD(P)-dependent dehydrogenase (short-subunit alcohol dehydrogenase family)
MPLALIVGCGDIALACARLIGRRHPLFLIDIDQGRLDAAREALKQEGYAVDGKVCDIAAAESVADLRRHLQAGPGLSVLAHVAALAPSCGDWRKLMTVNLVGPHLIAAALGPLMVPGGAAVFVGSVAAYVLDIDARLRTVLADPLASDFLVRLEAAAPVPMTPGLSYAYSKAALVAWCERLAVEWGARGVRVISVSPGLIRSAMGARERAHNPDTAKFVGQTPLRREGSVAEVAAVVDFAVSEAASFMTGIDLLVDGGLRAATRQPPAG